MRITPPIPWLGGKSKLTGRIVGYFPEHHTYVEPFGGSAAVLLAKTPAKVEIYNDIDQELSKLLQALRAPLQSSSCPAIRRRLSGIERLHVINRRMRGVNIESTDWAEIIARHDTPETLFYLDPPSCSDEANRRLVSILLAICGMAVLSSHDSEAFTRLEDAGWQRVDFKVPAYVSAHRKHHRKSLWISPQANQPIPQLRSRLRKGAYLAHRQRHLFLAC